MGLSPIFNSTLRPGIRFLCPLGDKINLPVPVPAERRVELRSRQHLTGRLRLRVDGVIEAETHLAGLERGAP